MSDFKSKFHSLASFFQDAAKSIGEKFDHFSFKTLVDLLKSDDAEAVSTAIEQLTNEKRQVSIPPLFFVYKEHPSVIIRQKAKKAIDAIGDEGRVKELTDGKSTEEAVKALIGEYGHYRA
ncbi:MAG: hypothetical protein K2Z81_15330 [Cyanobacteria bacterium]|nr:hypothetical protein [Cyanobacteriota bacterium]